MVTKRSIRDFIYLLGFSMGLIGSFILTTTLSINNSYNLIAHMLISLGAVIVFFSLLFIEENISIDIFIFCLLLLFLCFINKSIIGNNTLFLTMVYVISSLNISFEKILRNYTFITLLLLLLTILLALSGKIMNLEYFRNGKLYIALGGVYTTNMASHFFYIILAYVILKKFNLNKFSILILLLISFGIYTIFGAKLDSILVLIIAIISFTRVSFFNYFKKIHGIYLSLLASIIIIASLLTTYYFSYTNKVSLLLNEFFNNRLSQGRLAFSKYPVRLMGQHIYMQGFGGVNGMTKNFLEYFYIDNSFLQILLINGTLIFVLICVILIVKIYNFQNEEKYILTLMFLLVVISSIIDENLLSMSYNFSIFAFLTTTANYISSKHKNKIHD